MAAVFSIVTGWTLFGGLTLSIGAVVTRWVILPRAFPGEDSSSGSRRTAATVGLVGGATLVLVGVVLYFLRQLQEFRDPFVPWTEDANLLLTGTSWGTAWLAAALGAVVLAVAMTIARSGSRVGWWLATPVALALGAFPGFTGHASGVEELRALTLFADSMHVWAAGAWIGGLAVVLYVNRSLEANGGHSRLPSLVPAFSRVAMASVAALVVTGTFASWSQLPDLASIWTTGYGRILIAKLVVVGAVLAMGARNFRILTPQLGTDGGNEAMRRSATLELAVAHIVLILTAVLVRTSPLGH